MVESLATAPKPENKPRVLQKMGEGFNNGTGLCNLRGQSLTASCTLSARPTGEQ